MILDGQLDFGVKTQGANAASGGVLGSTNVFDAGESKKLFGHDEMWLWARFGVTQCSQVQLDLRGDTTAATLATGGADTETIASTGSITADEVGTALADDATERFVTVRIRIPKQKLAMRYYGLWITTTGTGDTVTAGDAYVVMGGQNHLLGARAAAPA
jgi:hypothetical protein